MIKYNRVLLVIMLALMLGACQSTPKGNPKRASAFNAKLGLEYLQSGDNKSALEKLEKALRQDEENATAHHYMAELYRRLGVEDTARGYYLRALELAPKDSSIKNNYAAFLCQQGAVDAAYKIFEKVLADPMYADKARVYENKALCAQLIGNIKLAHENYLLAVKYSHTMPRSLLALAQIEFDLQNRNAAYKYFNKFTKVSRHTPQSLWLGILLERGKGNLDRIASFSMILKGMYPDSKEAKLLAKLKKKGKI